MELRTRINPAKSSFTIGYSDPAMFLGSCFAAEIGSKLKEGKLPAIINPAGTVYNPVSVINTLNTILSGREIGEEDLYFHDGTWLSFFHYTSFSSHEKQKVIDNINRSASLAGEFLKKARVLFVTFGTARVYRFRETGTIVSNCHKLPAGLFDRELLSVERIAEMWNRQLDELQLKLPGLKVVFTISPVRHWKDGAHGNQVSKSILFLAVESLLSHRSSPGYFPAYEILIDDLRDYRFYDDDMLHPSNLAVDYIWEKFMECYLDETTVKVWKEVSNITNAVKHRVSSGNPAGIKKFAENMLSRIERMEFEGNNIDFTPEKEYFQSLAR